MRFYPVAYEKRVKPDSTEFKLFLEFFPSDVKARKEKTRLSKIEEVTGDVRYSLVMPPMDIPFRKDGIWKVIAWVQEAHLKGIDWVIQQAEKADQEGGVL